MAYNVGVNLIEGAGVSPIEGISTSVAAIIGTFERGPLNEATLVSSMAQFEAIFGIVPAPGSTSYYSVKAFFKKVGSAPLYIVRVASSTAAKAFVNFDDGSVDTLKTEAVSEGIWGNKLSVAIAADSILATAPAVDISATDTSAQLVSVEGLEVGSDIEFDNTTNQEYRRIDAINAATKVVTWTTGLTNAYPAATSTVISMEFKASLYTNGVLTEEHPGLGMNPDTTFFVEKALISDYIVGTDIKATKANDYTDLPAVAAATALTTGADGLADVTESDYSGTQITKTGVFALDEVEGLFRFCCPNPLLTDADIPAAFITLTQNLVDYAESRVTVLLYSDVPYNTAVTAAVTFGDTFVSRNLALFYPWLKVVENSLDTWLPPSSFVMGAAVEKDTRRGVHKNIGNEPLPYATELEYYVAVAEGEVLNDAGVNTVRRFTGRGIRVYGGRTRSAITSWRFLHYSELWNYLGRSIAVATQNVPFEPHDSFLWKSVIRRVTAFLVNEQARGALFDASNPTGVPFLVVMDATNNPPDQVALGIAKVYIEYVPVGAAEKFVIQLTNSPNGLTINA